MFSDSDHIYTSGEERCDRKKDWETENETKLEGLVCYLKGANRRQILRAKIIGAWLRVCGTTASGTVLSATEFWDFLCASYNVSPLNLQSHCKVCGTAFGVMHTLSCSTGSLVISRHNKIRDEILYIS